MREWRRATFAADICGKAVSLPCRYEASAPVRARSQYWDAEPGQEGSYGPTDVPYVTQDLMFVEKLSSYYCNRSGLVGFAVNNEPNVRRRKPNHSAELLVRLAADALTSLPTPCLVFVVDRRCEWLRGTLDFV